MGNYHKWLLAALFIFTLAFRLYFAFQTPYLTGDSAYFSLRQVEHIASTGLPLYYDPLSYGGRELIFPPLFHYIIAFFSLFMPAIIAAKLVPNILASSLIFFTYLIALELTKNRKIAIFTAAVSSFVPVFFADTINTLSPSSLLLPLIAFMLYCLLKVSSDRRFAWWFVAASLISAFTHPASMVLILGLVIYLAMVRLESMKQNRAETELILFSVFLTTLVNLLVFSSAFLRYGASAVWQNTPSALFSEYFLGITILGAIYKIGSLPFVDGIYMAYRYAFREKDLRVYLLIGLALAAGIVVYLKLVELSFGLMFAGLVLVLLFSLSMKSGIEYLKQTKFARYEDVMISVTFILFILTSFVPSFLLASESVAAAPAESDVAALQWIGAHTPHEDLVLSLPTEGHLISYFAGRSNVMDSNFMLVDGVDTRYEDVLAIYRTQIETEAITLLNKYEVRYIYLSGKAASSLKAGTLAYSLDENCFRLVYESSARVYRVMCSIR